MWAKYFREERNDDGIWPRAVGGRRNRPDKTAYVKAACVVLLIKNHA
jgi:hypothetical protein